MEITTMFLVEVVDLVVVDKLVGHVRQWGSEDTASSAAIKPQMLCL